MHWESVHCGDASSKSGPGLPFFFLLRDDVNICGQKYGRACHRQLKKKEVQQWSIEKPMLDNARQLRGIYFIDPDDGGYKEPLKNAWNKLDQWRRLCLVR